MFDDAIDPTDSGMAELARRLEAYADARLSPSAAATSHMRRNVMNVAHRRAALTAADAASGAAGATTAALAAGSARASHMAWRRPAAAIMAACLTLVMVAGTASAAKPGGPLYAARLWTEMANLPADVVARAQAEVSRLDARIQEAQEASTAGDGPAATAALSAYSVIVIEAANGTGGDPTASAAIEISVTRHVVVLTLLADSVPPPARAAVQQALSSSTKALDDLDGTSRKNDRDRPIDADVSSATGPDTQAKPLGPTKTEDPSPAAAAGNSPKPDKQAGRDKAGPAGGRDTPPPGHLDTDRANHGDPSGDPGDPDRHPAGFVNGGGT